MLIIGISGEKRNGKDTAADYIAEKYKLKKAPALADPIKEVAKIIFNWDYEKLYGNEKELIDKKYGISPRQFFQFFGTDFMQELLPKKFPNYEENIGRNIWVKILIEWIEKHKNERGIIVSDVRMPHEYEALNNKYNYYNIRIERDEVEQNSSHYSEIYIKKLPPFAIIKNNSTLESLFSNIDKVMTYIL